MSGPYFPGQKPSSCGHYYPDVLRLRDEKKKDGTFVRIMDCSYCGRYELPLDARTLDKELVRKLNRKGFAVGIKEGELSQVRKRALDRLFSDDGTNNRAFLPLQSILEGAINDGADSIELEYVDEGLEVTYMFRNRGIGYIVADHVLGKEIIELIVARAKLENRSRGMMDWTHRGKLYRITVVEYESFGESTFKLLLGKPSRKRA